MNSIRAKLLTVLLLIALIPLSVLGIINYIQTTQTFEQSIQDSLLTIIQTKNDRLEQYIEETELVGQSIADTDILQQYIASSVNTPEFNALQKQVDNLLYSFQEASWGKYHHIFLIDKTQQIIISPNHGVQEKGSPSSHLGENTSNNQWAVKAFMQGITTVSDYSSWVESDHTHQMLFFPVKDSAKVTQAVLGFELQIPYEKKLLEENFQLGQTGQVFLSTTDGVPILYQSTASQSPLNMTAVTEALKTGMSSGRRENSSGAEVVDLYLANEKYPWILVAEIETKEAFKSLNTIQVTLIIGLIATLIIVIIISYLFTNIIVNPIIKLTQQMESISLGYMDTKINYLKRNDEIGKLAQAFGRMVNSIKIAMKHLNKK